MFAFKKVILVLSLSLSAIGYANPEPTSESNIQEFLQRFDSSLTEYRRKSSESIEDLMTRFREDTNASHHSVISSNKVFSAQFLDILTKRTQALECLYNSDASTDLPDRTNVKMDSFLEVNKLIKEIKANHLTESIRQIWEDCRAKVNAPDPAK